MNSLLDKMIKKSLLILNDNTSIKPQQEAISLTLGNSQKTDSFKVVSCSFSETSIKRKQSKELGEISANEEVMTDIKSFTKQLRIQNRKLHLNIDADGPVIEIDDQDLHSNSEVQVAQFDFGSPVASNSYGAGTLNKPEGMILIPSSALLPFQRTCLDCNEPILNMSFSQFLNCQKCNQSKCQSCGLNSDNLVHTSILRVICLHFNSIWNIGSPSMLFYRAFNLLLLLFSSPVLLYLHLLTNCISLFSSYLTTEPSPSDSWLFRLFNSAGRLLSNLYGFIFCNFLYLFVVSPWLMAMGIMWLRIAYYQLIIGGWINVETSYLVRLARYLHKCISGLLKRIKRVVNLVASKLNIFKLKK